MSKTRRKFLQLLGLAAVAAPAIAKSVPTDIPWDIAWPDPRRLNQKELLSVYGRSPAMDALPDLQRLEMMLADATNRLVHPPYVVDASGKLITRLDPSEEHISAVRLLHDRVQQLRKTL